MRSAPSILIAALWLAGCAHSYTAEFRLRDTGAPVAGREVWLVKPSGKLVPGDERQLGVTNADGRCVISISDDESRAIVVSAFGSGGWAGFSNAGELVRVYADRDWIVNNGSHPSSRSAAARPLFEEYLGRGSRVEIRIKTNEEAVQ